MTGETTIKLALALPLMAAVTAGLFARRPNVRELFTLIAAGALLVVVASLTPGVFSGDRPGVTLFSVMPGLSIAFELEPLGMVFAQCMLWIVLYVRH